MISDEPIQRDCRDWINEDESGAAKHIIRREVRNIKTYRSESTKVDSGRAGNEAESSRVQ
jgi:hypothetical protein